MDKSEGFSGCGGPLFAETRSACYRSAAAPQDDRRRLRPGRPGLSRWRMWQRVYRHLLQMTVKTGETGPVYIHMGQREQREEVL